MDSIIMKVWSLAGRGRQTGRQCVDLPGKVECTPSSKLVSSTGSLRRNSLSVNVTGFLK